MVNSSKFIFSPGTGILTSGFSKSIKPIESCGILAAWQKYEIFGELLI
jgi:hypothetical protein